MFYTSSPSSNESLSSDTSAIQIGPKKELVHKTKESVFLIKLMPISKFFDETELVQIDLYVMSNFEHEAVSFHTLKGN